MGDRAARLRLDTTGRIIAETGMEAALGVAGPDVVGAHGHELVSVLGRTIDVTGEPTVETEVDGDTCLRLGVADGDDIMVFATPAAPDEQAPGGTWVYLARASRV